MHQFHESSNSEISTSRQFVKTKENGYLWIYTQLTIHLKKDKYKKIQQQQNHI